MGLFRKYVNQTRKPEGFLGKLMVDGMKCCTAEELASALKAAGFAKVCVHRHPKRPWLAVVAGK